MNKQFWIILLFACSVFADGGRRFLTFAAHKSVKERKLSYEMNLEEINIDAYFQEPVVIKYNQDVRYTGMPYLNFYCVVDELDPRFSISSAFLCRKLKLSSKEECIKIDSGKFEAKFNEFVSFSINYNNNLGIEAKLGVPGREIKQTEPLDGFYYCRLTNNFATIESNYFEIQDFEYYKYKLSKTINPISRNFKAHYIKDINYLSFPVSLECGKPTRDVSQQLPDWLPKSLILPFNWFYCLNVDSTAKCYAAMIASGHNPLMKSKPIESLFDAYSNYNGTLVLLGFNGLGDQDVTFGCVYKSNPYQLYAMYMGKNSDGSWRSVKVSAAIGKYNKPINVLSPTKVNLEIMEGTYDSFRFKLSASYVANPELDMRQFEWKHNGYSVTTDFKATQYELIFPKVILTSHSGTYTLDVSQKYPKDFVTFQFTLKVKGIPKLNKNPSLKRTMYYFENQEVSIDVSFDCPLTKQSIAINGLSLDLSSDQATRTSRKELYNHYPSLAGMDFTAVMNPSTSNYSYKVANLTTNKNTLATKSHMITFSAQNNVGLSKASFFIQVFSHPQFIEYPSSFDCDKGCRNTEQHEFKCSIEESVYKAAGMSVKYEWYLNNQNIKMMDKNYQNSYFEISNDTFILKPINNNTLHGDKLINMLLNAVLKCRVEIFYYPNKYTVAKTIYSSENFELAKLKAKIRLKVEIVARGSPTWILPLIISLILFLIVIIGIIVFFKRQTTGESYNVDKKEKEQGRNPEKEIDDLETFKPYERDFDNHLVANSRLSFNDEDSVGMGSDDGELDVYDIDPGKFNEEGSFIGQYASDPRKSSKLPIINGKSNGTTA